MNVIDYKPRPRARKNKITLTAETRNAVRSLLITLTSMIIVLSIVFLVSTNEGAQKGYALEQAKLKNEYLKTENENLNTKITKSTAFTDIKDQKKVQEMETNEEKNYVTQEDNLVN